MSGHRPGGRASRPLLRAATRGAYLEVLVEDRRPPGGAGRRETCSSRYLAPSRVNAMRPITASAVECVSFVSIEMATTPGLDGSSPNALT